MPHPDNLDETRELIRMAQAVRNSLWYQLQRDKLAEGEHPTLAIVLALVDRLAIYSAHADGPSAGDPRR